MKKCKRCWEFNVIDGFSYCVKCKKLYLVSYLKNLEKEEIKQLKEMEKRVRKSKSFFNYSDKEKKKILNKAAKISNEEQRKVMKFYDTKNKT